MKNVKMMTAGVAAAAAMALTAAPASAQYYPYERDRGISAGEIIAGVAAVAGVAAIASAATQRGGYGYGYDPRYGGGYGHDRGLERHAVNACTYEAQRRFQRRGQVRVDVRQVQPTRNGVRVLAAADIRDYRWGGGQRQAFSCEVRARDGRVSRFQNHNYRW